MTGRPGYWTMEMNGGSSAPYLACTPCVPLFVHCLIRVEAEGLLDYQGRAGIISIVRWNLRPVIFVVDFVVIVLMCPVVFLLSVCCSSFHFGIGGSVIAGCSFQCSLCIYFSFFFFFICLFCCLLQMYVYYCLVV